MGSRRKGFISFCDTLELAEVIDRREARMSPSLRRFDQPDLFHDHDEEDLVSYVKSCAQALHDHDPHDPHEEFLMGIGALSRRRK